MIANEDPDIRVAEVDTNIDEIDSEEVDGIVRLAHELPARTELPFRSEEKGGVNRSPPPFIWTWTNPDSMPRNVSLSPTYEVRGLEIRIENGDAEALW